MFLERFKQINAKTQESTISENYVFFVGHRVFVDALIQDEKLTGSGQSQKKYYDLGYILENTYSITK